MFSFLLTLSVVSCVRTVRRNDGQFEDAQSPGSY